MDVFRLGLWKKRTERIVPQMIDRILCMQISADRRQSITDWEQLPLMLTTEDLMNVLGVSRTRAYQIIKIKDFPSVRIGKLVYMEKYALRKWIEVQSNQA